MYSSRGNTKNNTIKVFMQGIFYPLSVAFSASPGVCNVRGERGRNRRGGQLPSGSGRAHRRDDGPGADLRREPVYRDVHVAAGAGRNDGDGTHRRD